VREIRLTLSSCYLLCRESSRLLLAQGLLCVLAALYVSSSKIFELSGARRSLVAAGSFDTTERLVWERW